MLRRDDVVSTSITTDGEVNVTKSTPTGNDKDYAAPSDESETNTKTSAVEETVEEAFEDVEEQEVLEKDIEEAETAEGDADEQSDESKKSGVEKRIEKILKRETAAKREADALRTELAALKAGKTEPVVEAPAVEELKVEVPEKPKPEDFDSHADYVEALVDHKEVVKQKTAEAAQAKQTYEAEVQRANKHIGEAMERGKAKYDDYMDAVNSTKTGPTAEMVSYLLETEAPEEMVYYLSKNQDELAAIQKLKGTAVSRAMALIETKLTASAKSAIEPSAPIQPVGGKAKTPVGLRDDLSTDEWLARRKAEKYGKRR